MNDDDRLARIFQYAHAGAPAIPFARVAARRREPGAARTPRRARAPRLAAALATVVIAVAGVVALRTPAVDDAALQSPLADWHAPTDFLLATRGASAPTDFLLTPSSVAPDPITGDMK